MCQYGFVLGGCRREEGLRGVSTEKARVARGETRVWVARAEFLLPSSASRVDVAFDGRRTWKECRRESRPYGANERGNRFT